MDPRERGPTAANSLFFWIGRNYLWRDYGLFLFAFDTGLLVHAEVANNLSDKLFYRECAQKDSENLKHM